MIQEYIFIWYDKIIMLHNNFSWLYVYTVRFLVKLKDSKTILNAFLWNFAIENDYLFLGRKSITIY